MEWSMQWREDSRRIRYQIYLDSDPEWWAIFGLHKGELNLFAEAKLQPTELC